jgi:hypothetical protein
MTKGQGMMNDEVGGRITNIKQGIMNVEGGENNEY